MRSPAGPGTVWRCRALVVCEGGPQPPRSPRTPSPEEKSKSKSEEAAPGLHLRRPGACGPRPNIPISSATRNRFLWFRGLSPPGRAFFAPRQRVDHSLRSNDLKWACPVRAWSPPCSTTAASTVGSAIPSMASLAQGKVETGAEVEARLRAAAPARDPEKWIPVFGKDHAQNKSLERDDDSTKNHSALRPVLN